MHGDGHGRTVTAPVDLGGVVGVGRHGPATAQALRRYRQTVGVAEAVGVDVAADDAGGGNVTTAADEAGAGSVTVVPPPAGDVAA